MIKIGNFELKNLSIKGCYSVAKALPINLVVMAQQGKNQGIHVTIIGARQKSGVA
jgi:hypothetical protein